MRIVLLLLASTLIGGQLWAQSNFIIRLNTEVKTKGGVYLVLNNTHLSNEGVLDQPVGGGAVKFTGNANVTLYNGNVITLNRLLLSKTTGTNVVLQGKLGVRSEVFFTTGSLHLQYAYSVLDLLGTGALRNETETNRAYSFEGGSVQTVADLYAPSSANPGNLGAIITSASDLGLTSISRSHSVYTNVSGTNSSVLRQYTIRPENNSDLNATLRFHYLDAELNGLDESNLTIWESNDLSSWSKTGYDAKDAQANYFIKTALPDLSIYTLSVDDGTLTGIAAGRLRDYSPSEKDKEATGLTAAASPNPASKYFTITAKSRNLTDKINLTILDAVGRIVEAKTSVSNQTVQLGYLYRPGIYYADVVQGKQRVIIKLIKEE